MGRDQRQLPEGRPRTAECASTPYQTAWALLGLLAAGEAHSDAARRAVNHLLRTQQPGGLWSDATFTAPGFPARLLSQVSRLLRLLPALGAGQLPHVDPGRDRPLNAAGVVAALAAEARALGPAQPKGEGLAVLADGNLLVVSGMGPRAGP